jgi:ppGpp synthetase/RelA/SpoT-type nucleotidyltranferase
MENAYAKKSDAFVGLKPLESYFVVENSATAKPSVAAPTSSVEERVKKLKSLLEKGLITETQFNEQLKVIIEN